MGKSKKAKKRKQVDIKKPAEIIRNDNKNTKIKNRSVVLGIISIAITCLDLITIFATYRGIIIMLPAPIILGIIALLYSKKDKNETGFVYGVIAVSVFCIGVVAIFLLYFLIRLSSANNT